VVSEAERDALLARLATALEKLDEPRGGGWLDRRSLATTLLAFALGSLMSFGVGLWGKDGISHRVESAIASGVQNAGEIRRVESDSRDRDKELAARLDKSIGDHMQYQHGGRRSSVTDRNGLPALPLLSAHGGG